MTKETLPLTPERALTRVAGVIGWPEVARIAGRSERQVRRWGDRDVTTVVSLKTAAALDVAHRAAGGDGFPLSQWLQLTVEIGAGRAAACIVEQAERAAHAAEEAGQAIAAQIRALRPGADRRDHAVAARETEEAIGALTSTLRDLDGRGEG